MPTLRSVTVLAAAFAGVTAVTIALALLVVSGSPQVGRDPSDRGDAPGEATPLPETPRIPGLGGELAVSGDRDGTFRLTSVDEGEPYALTGSDGRIVFAGRPVSVTQISYEGLEFFPDPGQCTITTGNLEGALGIAFAQFRCRDLDDARGNGTIDLEGEIGLPLDQLAERTLPASGGSLQVGSEAWGFEEASLATWQMPIRAGVTEPNLALVDRERGTAFNVHFDHETRRLSASSVERGGEEAKIPDGACSFERTELGSDSPRVAVIELRIECGAVEVPGLGSVPIRGTVIVDELAYPV